MTSLSSTRAPPVAEVEEPGVDHREVDRGGDRRLDEAGVAADPSQLLRVPEFGMVSCQMVDHLTSPPVACRRIGPGTPGPARVTRRVTFRARSGPPAVVRQRYPAFGTVSWRGFYTVCNSLGSARPVWGTEGREFKSPQPDR